MADHITINLPVRETSGRLMLYSFRISRELFEDAPARYAHLVGALAMYGVPAPADIELVPTSVKRTEYTASEEYQAQ